jgi:hypothetical protein
MSYEIFRKQLSLLPSPLHQLSGESRLKYSMGPCVIIPDSPACSRQKFSDLHERTAEHSTLILAVIILIGKGQLQLRLFIETLNSKKIPPEPPEQKADAGGFPLSAGI